RVRRGDRARRDPRRLGRAPGHREPGAAVRGGARRGRRRRGSRPAGRRAPGGPGGGRRALAHRAAPADHPGRPRRRRRCRRLRCAGAADARIELVLPAAGGGEERLWLEGPGTTRSVAATPAVQVALRERGASAADPEPVLRRTEGEVLPAGDVLAAGTVVPRDSPGLQGAEALALPDGRLRTDLELSAGASEVLLLGAADVLRLELDGADRGVHVAHGDPLCLPLTPGAPHRLRVTT